MKIKKIAGIAILSVLLALPVMAKEEEIFIPQNYPEKYNAEKIKAIKPMYKNISKEQVIHVALDMLQGTNGDFSRKAIIDRKSVV